MISNHRLPIHQSTTTHAEQDRSQRLQLLLRRFPGVDRPEHPDPRAADHRADRAVGLRQVHVFALPEPDERHHRGTRAGGRCCWTARTSTPPTSMWSICASASAWCFSAPILSRRASTTTWPLGHACWDWPKERSWTNWCRKAWRALHSGMRCAIALKTRP